MLSLSISLFILAALLGLYLISFVLQRKETPKGVVFIHGPIAALGLITLIIYTIFYSTKPLISLIVFVLAALGGIYLVLVDLTGHKPPPIALALMHGLAAVAGFGLLIYLVWF